MAAELGATPDGAGEIGGGRTVVPLWNCNGRPGTKLGGGGDGVGQLVVVTTTAGVEGVGSGKIVERFGGGMVVPGIMITGGQTGQSVVTVRGVGTLGTLGTIVELGQEGHEDVTVSVVFGHGRPGATGGQVGHGRRTVIVVGGTVIVVVLVEDPPGQVGHGIVVRGTVVLSLLIEIPPGQLGHGIITVPVPFAGYEGNTPAPELGV